MADSLLSEYMTPAECAAELVINARTLERWARLRQGPAKTKIGNKVMYRREAVIAWLREREQAA